MPEFFKAPLFKRLLLGLSSAMPLGCNLLSVQEPPTEYDTQADILAVVAPDTLQAGTSARVQFSFQKVCGGSFSRDTRSESGTQVTFTPILHVVMQSNCPAVYAVQTVSDSVTFDSSGTYSIFIVGRSGVFAKTVVVVPFFPARNSFTLRFRFQTADSASGSPFYSTSFAFLNRPPSYSFPIVANASGEWDTTFVDTLPRVQYSISFYSFEAVQGIKDDGVIIVPNIQ